jgi:hypothetical protein
MSSNLDDQCLELAKAVSGWAQTTLQQLKVSGTDKEQVFFVTHAVRSLVYTQSIITLCEKGLIEPAGALLRVLLEQAFVLAALEKDRSLFDEYEKQGNRERLKALSELEKLDEAELPDWFDKKDIEGFTAQVPPATKHGFSAYYWAEKADMLNAYRTIYRLACTYSHGSILGFDAYLKVDSNGVATGIQANALIEHRPQFLITAASTLANTIAGLGNAGGLAIPIAQELQRLQDKINEQNEASE